MRLIPMERIAHQTLLGIRFWDRLLGRPVSDGLWVRAQRLTNDRVHRTGRPVIGQPTPSGVIAFNGLHPAERVPSDSDEQIWETVPAPIFAVIDVVDRARRYLPMSFVVRVPLDGAGFFRGRGGWLNPPSLLAPEVDEGTEPGVYLWSAPTRPMPDGRAHIRAQIVVGDGEQPPPAPHALVIVTEELPEDSDEDLIPMQYAGIADENGMLALPMPYPPVPDPEDEYPPLQAQTFPLLIKVYYEPDLIADNPLPGSDAPNFELVLRQAEAEIGSSWNEDAPPELQYEETLRTDLRYGQALILRTVLVEEPPEAESFLRIQPV